MVIIITNNLFIFKRDESLIKENWSSILYNIKGYKEILEIEQRIKNNRENPWQKMIENIAVSIYIQSTLFIPNLFILKSGYSEPDLAEQIFL